MQKYTYIKIFRFFFLDVTLLFFKQQIFSFHFELKKKITIMIRKNGFIALLQIILCISSLKKNLKNKMTYILMISDEKYEVSDVNEMDRYRESGNIN